jgi:hypothetical protein
LRQQLSEQRWALLGSDEVFLRRRFLARLGRLFSLAFRIYGRNLHGVSLPVLVE